MTLAQLQALALRTTAARAAAGPARPPPTSSFAGRLVATTASRAPSTHLAGSSIVAAALSESAAQKMGGDVAARSALGSSSTPSVMRDVSALVTEDRGNGGGAGGGASDGGGSSGGGSSGGGSSGGGSGGGGAFYSESPPPGGWAVDNFVQDSARPPGSLDFELARSSALMMQLIHLQMEENDMQDDMRSNMEKLKHETKKNTVGNVR